MRLLITGSSGQLGTALQDLLAKYYEIVNTTRHGNNSNTFNLDITNKIMLKEVLDATKPDLIINLAAMTNVDLCERDPSAAKRVNLLGVENICNLFDGKIIQISSDYVFDGKMGPYTEDDNTNPISIYGKTKLLAEKVVLNHNDENIVLRTNVLYSYNSKTNACFVNWVVRSLKEKRQIYVVNDQYNNPTWTKSISRVILLCIQKKISGLYHWGDGNILSRYQFSLKIAKIFNLDSSLIKSIKTSKLSQLAKRPLRSGLISKKMEEAINVYAPAVEDCLKIISGQKNMRTIVICPTYNEIKNIAKLIQKILDDNPYDLLVIDDNSPDGTSEKVKEYQKIYKNLFLEIREGKQGLGTAYIHGFNWAIQKGYDSVVQMDADLSHNPKDLKRLIKNLETMI